MRMAPQVAVDFVQQHEAFKPTAYKPTKADVWTIGYGHTTAVKEGDTVTRDDAMKLLAIDLDTAGRRLGILIPHVVDTLTVNQYSALLSFVFNVGADPDWAIWRELNAGRLENVPAQLRRFVYQKKRRLPGLVNRREDEVALWQRA